MGAYPGRVSSLICYTLALMTLAAALIGFPTAAGAQGYDLTGVWDTTAWVTAGPDQGEMLTGWLDFVSGGSELAGSFHVVAGGAPESCWPTGPGSIHIPRLSSCIVPRSRSRFMRSASWKTQIRLSARYRTLVGRGTEAASGGSTSAGFRAGVPSLVIPHIIDQFIWGNKVAELGVGPKPIARPS